MTSKYQIDMTGEHVLRNIFLFSYPLMISNLCQRLLNAADTLIVGRFSGAEDMAAVGAVGPLVDLFTWGLLGFSVGVDVVVSGLLGEGNKEGAGKSVHTAYSIAILAGFITTVIGLLFSGRILKIMDTPADIAADSTLYIRIYFIGLFFNVIFNFGAACLRSDGDTKRPTAFMILAGVINVLLNLVAICIFRMGVAGVAIATVIAQIFSAVMVTVTLMKNEGPIHLNLKEIRPDMTLAKRMIGIGLPSMFQNMLFSISNIVVQSSVNSFGTVAVAGNSAAETLENLVYVVSNAVNQTCITFTGQNHGAGNRRNIVRILRDCILLQCTLGFAIGILLHVNDHFVLSLFTTKENVIEAGTVRLAFVALWLFLNGVSDVFAGSLRAIGYSLRPTLIALMGICGFRLLYIFYVLPHRNMLSMLYLCYPLSWIITTTCMMIMWFVLHPKNL